MSAVFESRAQVVAREDLLTFLNACFACTGQREFHAPSGGRMGLDFLHDYVLVNYRRVYARALAAGINHENQAEIVVRLLAAGAPRDPSDRAEEAALITRALALLPPQRAYRALARLAALRVNNRRTRAVIARYAAGRAQAEFELVKYRDKARRALRHAHAAVSGERGRYLFGAMDGPRFKSALFESARCARYSKEAVYALPFSIAEGFASRHGIARDTFLARIAPRMTAHERLRLHAHAEDEGVALDPSRASLTRLASYFVSLPDEARAPLAPHLDARARGVARSARLGRVAAVLDNSFSASGSREKARRPLAVALAVSRVLRASASDYAAHWTCPADDELRVRAVGPTDLARPLLAALRSSPELVVIVSDGFENAPAGGVAEVVRLCRARLASRVPIVHLNPAFEGDSLAPRGLAPDVATVGLRDAESLFVALGFARFALGAATLAELEDYLAARVRAFLAE